MHSDQNIYSTTHQEVVCHESLSSVVGLVQPGITHGALKAGAVPGLARLLQPVATSHVPPQAGGAEGVEAWQQDRSVEGVMAQGALCVSLCSTVCTVHHATIRHHWGWSRTSGSQVCGLRYRDLCMARHRVLTCVGGGGGLWCSKLRMLNDLTISAAAAADVGPKSGGSSNPWMLWVRVC